MKLLIIHNEYQIRGGEDAVVEKQFNNLTKYNIKVKKYCINNSEIDNKGSLGKIYLFINNLFLAHSNPELIRYIDEYKPDIAHIHNVYPLINPRVYYELHKRGIKIVQTLHNYRFLCPNGLFFHEGKVCEDCITHQSLYQCYNKKCYRNSKIQSFWYARMISVAKQRGYFNYIDKFIALNQFMKNKMIDNGYDSDKFVVIPNAIEYDESVQENSVKKDYYLYIGRLSAEKGIVTLCNGYKTIDRELKIVGTGPLQDEVESICTESTNIQYLGYKKGKEKEKIISEAKAIIVPSEWYENLPTVIIEAFMLRTPVIVSKLGGAQYMVDEGINGTKFEAGNDKDLVRAINRLEELDQGELQANSFNTFITTYEDSVVTKQLIKLYEEICQN